MSKAAEPCRSCGAGIYWLKHEKTGKPAPIDATPTAFGNLLVDLEHGSYRTASAAKREGRADLYVNHFANCPQAKTWHRNADGSVTQR